MFKYLYNLEYYLILLLHLQFELSDNTYLRKDISVVSSVHQNQHKYNIGCNNSDRKH